MASISIIYIYFRKSGEWNIELRNYLKCSIKGKSISIELITIIYFLWRYERLI